MVGPSRLVSSCGSIIKVQGKEAAHKLKELVQFVYGVRYRIKRISHFLPCFNGKYRRHSHSGFDKVSPVLTTRDIKANPYLCPSLLLIPLAARNEWVVIQAGMSFVLGHKAVRQSRNRTQEGHQATLSSLVRPHMVDKRPLGC